MAEWIAYIDESGNRSGTEGEGKHFVLACVAGSLMGLNELEEKIRRLKLKLAPKSDPSGWELHAADIMHNRGTSPLGTTSMDKKLSIMQEIMDIVNECDVVLFGISVKSTMLRKRNFTPYKITEHAMELLVERLEMLAQEVGMPLRVISDNMDEKYRPAMRSALRRRAARRLGSFRGMRVAGITFVDSRFHALVQAADAIAYIINRYIGGDEAFKSLFDDIERKAWRGETTRGLYL